MFGFSFLCCVVFCVSWFLLVCLDLAPILLGSDVSPELQNHVPLAKPTSPPEGPKDASIPNCPKSHSSLVPNLLFLIIARTSPGMVPKPKTWVSPFSHATCQVQWSTEWQVRVQNLPLPLTNCVSLSCVPNNSMPQFLHLKNTIIILTASLL